MNIIGIIIEANPLHSGHKYLIETVKKELNPDCLIAITSTYFSMRGDLSILSKYEKTNILLENGFDLVLELPVDISMNRADLFSKGAINILKNFKINYLAFGSENTNIKELIKVSNIINSDDYIKEIKENKTASMKKILESKLKDLPSNLLLPNSTLAISYLNEIKNTNIKPFIIKRESDYNNEEINEKYPSANSLRIASYNNNDISTYLNYKININYKDSIINLFTLIKNRLLAENTTNYDDLEGIGNYIKLNGDFNLDYFEFINKLSNSKYTKTRIKRYLTELLINKEKHQITYNYYRVLGFNKAGLNLISDLDKATKELLFSNPNELKNKQNINEIISIYNNEENYAKIYGIITNNYNLYLDEYKFPIKK